MKQLLWSLYLLFFLLFAVSCGPYSGYRRANPMDPLYGVERFSRMLNLNPDQLQAISNLRDNFRKEDSKIKGNLEASLVDLRQMTRRPKKDLNEDEIMEKIKEVGNLETELRQNAARTGFSLAQILTDEQYDRFAEILRREQIRY
jgi:Spy/CpxP family protein refolding chaperone